MSDLNGFRAYESAIIGGLLASGQYDLKCIQSAFRDIRNTARKFSGGVQEVHPPVGIDFVECFAAERCAFDLLDKPRPLAEVIAHLKSAGFEERLARYAYSLLLKQGDATIDVIDCVPMLSKAVRV